mmetsp:Transcript_26592/g.53269  ORF Transcript_26592/g.53269 Transcript_26592/m.53269 type:complete len:738 (+) Transcript_26592:10-2223(+)
MVYPQELPTTRNEMKSKRENTMATINYLSSATVNNGNNKQNIEDTVSRIVKDNTAADVLRRLLESGKITTDDVTHSLVSTTSTALQPSSSGANYSKSSSSIHQDSEISGMITPNNKETLSQTKEKSKSPSEKLRTRHIALQFSYDGTDYSGFAENVGKENDKSVEKSLFAALEKTCLLLNPDEMEMVVLEERTEGDDGARVQINEQNVSVRTASKYSRCGRTDKGVHAHGQVVALYLKSAFPLLAKKVMGDDTLTPGDRLVEEDLPKNSLDGLECFVPPRKNNNKKKEKKNAKKGEKNNTVVQKLDVSIDETDTASSPALILKTIHEYDYARVLNNILPPSIRILGWCPVSPEFSARFSCCRRTYRYFFPRRDLDLHLMAQGLNYMMGRHDFRNMCKMNCEQVYNFERVLMKGKIASPQAIYEVAMKEDDEKKTEDVSLGDNSNEQDDVVIKEMAQSPLSPRDMCHVEITGQAFLWHQIRCIMSILFFVGRKLESPTIVNELVDIQANPAKPAYEMASETALVLHDCTFGKLHMGRTVKILWEVTKTLEQRWERHAVAAERARNALDSLKAETQVKWSDVVAFVEQIAKEKRRKERKYGTKLNDSEMNAELVIRDELKKRAPVSENLSWCQAVDAIQDILGVYPYLPNGNSDGGRGLTESSIHVPLMERSKGTTYEEKVQSILACDDVSGASEYGGQNRKSSKRRERYEENIIKKRKTSEEDKAFYDHMLRQGGSST